MTDGEEWTPDDGAGYIPTEEGGSKRVPIGELRRTVVNMRAAADREREKDNTKAANINEYWADRLDGVIESYE